MGGPSYHPEKAVGRSYPKPKKGSRVTCLACKNGKVMDNSGKIKDCGPCKGHGYIIAK
jgi:hypothetical protein